MAFFCCFLIFTFGNREKFKTSTVVLQTTFESWISSRIDESYKYFIVTTFNEYLVLSEPILNGYYLFQAQSIRVEDTHNTHTHTNKKKKRKKKKMIILLPNKRWFQFQFDADKFISLSIH